MHIFALEPIEVIKGKQRAHKGYTLPNTETRTPNRFTKIKIVKAVVNK